MLGDKKPENAQAIAKSMTDVGFDVLTVKMDLASRASIRNLIAEAQQYGDIAMLVNAAGVSLSQTPIEVILKVDLYGTAVLLEEVGKVIKRTAGVGCPACLSNGKTLQREKGHGGSRQMGSQRSNSISPGIVVTPLALDEFNGPRGGADETGPLCRDVRAH